MSAATAPQHRANAGGSPAVWLALALLVFVAASTRVHAALADCELERHHWGYGEIRAVATWAGGGENIAVLASGAMLQVYDVSAPAAPVLLGEVNVTEAIHHVAIAGDGQLAATASRHGGITLVDLGDRTAPTVRGVHPVIGRLPGGMAFDGDLLHAAITPAGLLVLDVGNPDAPVELAQVVTLGTDSFSDVAVRGDHVYAADDLEGVTVWDVSTPSAPVLAGAYPTAAAARHIEILGDRAYVARQHEGFDILDLTVPTAPVLLGSVAEPGNYSRAVFANGHLVLPTNSDRLRVFDLADPSAPQWVAELEADTHSVRSAAALGNTVFVAGPPGLRSVDVTAPALPAYIAEVVLPGVASKLHATDGRVYVPQGARGLAILGNTAANRAIEIGRFDATSIHNVVAFGNHAIGNDVDDEYRNWLRILDVSDASAPQLLASEEMPAAAYQYSVDGDDLFVATPAGLRIYDLSTPTVPALRSAWSPPDLATLAVLARGARAYIGGNGWVGVLDVADRTSPQLLGSYAYGQPVKDFALRGDTLFVVGGQETVHALDVSDPTAIAVRSVTDFTPGAGHALELDGDRLYVASGTIHGTLAYDVSDPGAPVLVEQFDTTDEMVDVGVDNDTLVVAEKGNGVRFFGCAAAQSSPDAIFTDGFEDG